MIYLACPYSHDDSSVREHRFHAACRAAAQLIRAGHVVFCPVVHSHPLAEVDADHWKTFAHQRLGTPLDQPGALTLFHAPPVEHLALAKHLTAERTTEEFVAGKGVVTKWERVRRANHWFDALYNACAAGHFCGVRLIGERPEKKERFSLSALQRQRRDGK